MKRFIAALALCVFASTPAFACDDDDADGLDVGLVLSGGGAKASTQVGVMQVMEELGVPVHCIAGSSMGAVVGSFYASGYSANEIAELFENEDWGAAFRGTVPRNDRSFIQKERDEAYMASDLIGLSPQGVRLPGGLNSMRGLRELYRGILREVPLDADFDKLGIPFRPVGTRLETGEAVAFAEGDLVESILVSMAVPGVFAPRVIDGVAYVDGGVSTNLPVQTVKDMGADIVIALDTTVAPREAPDQYSLITALQQVTTLLIHNNAQRDKENLGPDDLYAYTNTIDLPTAGYARSAEGVEAGRAVGEELREQLLAIKARAAPPLSRETDYSRPDVFESVSVRNATGIDDDIIIARADVLKDSPDKVNQRLRDLSSFGGIGEVDFAYNAGEAVLQVGEHPLGRTRMTVGFNAATNFDGGSEYGILAQVRRQPFNATGGDLTLSAEIGTNNAVALEYYQPLGGAGRLFFQPEVFARRDRREFDVDDVRIANFRVDTYGARARLGRELGRWGVVALEGGIRETAYNSIITVIPDLEEENFQLASVGLFLGADTLDRTDWPTQGYRLRLRSERFFDISDEGSLETDRFEADALYATQFGSIGLLLNGRYGTLDSDLIFSSPDTAFELGGFRQLSAFRDNSLPVDELIYGSAEIFRRITGEGFIVDLPVYVGAIAEYAQIPLSFFEIDAVEDAYSGSVYIGSDTPLGPVFFGAAIGNDETTRLFFRFGRTF